MKKSLIIKALDCTKNCRTLIVQAVFLLSFFLTSINVQSQVTVNSPTICNGASVVLTANGVGAYTWAPGGETTKSILVSPGATTTYTVTDASDATSAVSTVTVDAGPPPVLTITASSNSICSGTATDIDLTSDMDPTTQFYVYKSAFQVFGSSSDTIAFPANIGQTLSSNPPTVTGTVTYTVIPVNGGCMGTQDEITITVYPKPKITGASDDVICSGSMTNINLGTTFNGTTITWGNPVEAGTSGASAGFGVDVTSINQTLISTSGGSTLYELIPSANGCTGNQVDVAITVNAIPTITSALSQTVCSGLPSTLVDLEWGDTAVISSAWFSWVAVGGSPAVSGFDTLGLYNDPPSDTEQADTIPVQTITSTNSVLDSVIYTITVNGCTTPTTDYTIYVEPTPKLTNIPATQSICSGANSSLVTLTSDVPSTFTWFTFINPSPTGANVVGEDANGASSLVPVQTISTSNLVTDTVVYRTSMTSLSFGCVGIDDYAIFVKPLPLAISTPSTDTICSGTAFSKTLSTSYAYPGVTYDWTADASGIAMGSAASGTTNPIAETLTNAGNVLDSAIYSITATSADGCVGAVTEDSVYVYPTPNVTTPPAFSICSDSTTLIELTSDVPGTTFSWTVIQSGTVSGGFNDSNDTIQQTLSNSGTTAGTAIYTVTPIANGCPGPASNIVVTVEPVPNVIATPAAQTICSDSTTLIALSSSVAGTTFSWTAVNSAFVSGAYGDSQDTIQQQLTNSGTTVGTATYTITPSVNGCPGAPIIVVINVDPTPNVIVSPSSQTICSDSTTLIKLSSSVIGTTFSWTVVPSSGFLSGAFDDSNDTIQQTLSNSGTVAETAVYTITPIINSCPGAPKTVTVTVNPTPNVNLSSAAKTICAGEDVNVTLTSSIPGTVFTWLVDQVGVSGASIGSSTTVISQTLTTTGNVSGTATYTVTPNVNGCPGLPKVVVVTVNPAPIVTATNALDTICSGTEVNITLSSIFVPAPTYVWTVSEVGAINSGPSSGTTSPITQTLTATGNVPGVATYTIIPTAAGCPGIPVYDTITVAPVPDVIATPTDETICSGTATGIALTTTVGGTNFVWSVDQTGGGGVSGGSAGSGTAIIQTLTATTALEGIATYSVTPFILGCAGTSVLVPISVQPSAALVLTDLSICAGTSPDILLSSPIVGTTFDWVQSQTDVLGARDSINVPNNGSIDQVLNTTTSASGSVTYTVTPVSVGCQGLPSVVNIAVSPISDVIVSNATDSICSGFPTGITLTSSIPGTLFDWTVAQTSITGASDETDTLGPINQTLVSTGIVAGTAVYSITPKLNNCPGTIVTTTVTVHPVSTATPASDTICTGTAPFIQLISPVLGTTFDWTVIESGVSGAVNMNNTDTINQILTLLPGSNTGRADYTITPSASGCPGTPIIVTVDVDSYEDPSFNYPSATFCPAAADPTPVITGVPGGTFSALPAGLVFLDINTGEIDLDASTLNSYTVQYTTPGDCKDSATFNVTIANPPSAGFGYPLPSYCSNSINPVPGFAPGASAGVFTSTAGLVFVDPFTGEVDIALSTPGTYTVTNTISCVLDLIATSTLLILPSDDASFTYSSATYCQSGLDPTPTVTGVGAGMFSALPAGLVFLSNATGEIDLSASTLGTYTVTYTTPGPCVDSSTFGITISNPPIASFHYAAAYCQNDSPNAIASFSLVPGASGGVFTAAAGIVFANKFTGEIDLTTSTPGTYMVYNTIPACATGSEFIDSNTVVINPQDNAAFNYTSGTFCQSGSNAIPVISGVAGGTFTASPAGIVFVSTTTGEIDVAASTVALNTYTITYTTNGVCPDSSTFGVSITNASPPVGDFSYAGPYCKNEANPTPTYTLGSGGVFSAPAGLVFANEYTGEIDLAASTVGTYTVTNTIDCNGTPIVDNNTVTIIGLEDVSFNYAYSTFCQSGVVTPTFIATAGGTFSASPGGIAFLSTTTGTINLAASSVGTYTVTYTYLGGACPSTDTFVLNITNLATPTATFSYASPFCQSSTPNALPSFSGGSFPGVFTSTSGLVFIDPYIGLIDLTSSTQGTYTVTNTFDCSGTEIKDSSVITITTFPSFTVPANPQVCIGDSVITTSFVNIPTYNWVNSNTAIGLAASGTGNVPGFVGTNSGSSSISGEITVTSTLNGCIGSIETYTVTVEPEVVADAGEPVTVVKGTSITLGGNPTGPSGSTYTWSPTEGFIDASYSNPNNQATITTMYTVTVTVGGCSSMDSVLVTVLPHFVPSGGFSPNQDGTNDEWLIDFLDFYPDCSVEIYNRWGVLLFQSSNGYSVPWDGNYKGKELPVGTYYYIINLNDPMYPDGITGPVTIMR